MTRPDLERHSPPPLVDSHVHLDRYPDDTVIDNGGTSGRGRCHAPAHRRRRSRKLAGCTAARSPPTEPCWRPSGIHPTRLAHLAATVRSRSPAVSARRCWAARPARSLAGRPGRHWRGRAGRARPDLRPSGALPGCLPRAGRRARSPAGPARRRAARHSTRPRWRLWPAPRVRTVAHYFVGDADAGAALPRCWLLDLGRQASDPAIRDRRPRRAGA